MVARGLMHSKVEHVIVLGYGMKSPVTDLISIAAFTTPSIFHISRYDLGRYVNIPYIPLFGTEEDYNIKAEMFPMLGTLGEGHGSLSIEFDTEDAQKCTFKVYPCVVHYLKA